MSLLPRHKYLTFHGIGPPPAAVTADELPYWVCLDLLQRTLRALGRIEARTGVSFHVTCDDGYASDYDHLLPQLVSLGRTGHFFPIASRIGAPGFVTGAQLREMRAAGMDIGGHGYSHVSWRQLDSVALEAELQHCRDRLEEILGSAVTSVAVPFGAFDARVVAAARGAGFERIFTSAGGLAIDRRGLIPRTTVKSDFVPERDLDRLVSVRSRMRSSLVGRVKRWAAGG